MKKFLALLALIVLLPLGAAAQNAAGKNSWEETLAVARAEGKLVISGPPIPELRQVLPTAFKARYGITIEYIAARGGTDAAARMRAERQAGIHSIDVVFAGSQSMALIFHREKMLQPLRLALQLPEVVDGKY